MNGEIYCANCGTPMRPDSRFCPACGAPVEIPQPAPSYNPPVEVVAPTEKIDEFPNNYSPRPPEYYPVEEQPPSRSRRGLILLAVGFAVTICCALVIIVWLISKITNVSPVSEIFSEATATFEPVTVTLLPTLPVPTPTSQILTGAQQLSDTSFYDDFSSNSLGWQQDSDESSAVGIENGMYMMEVKIPDYRHHVFTPLDSITHLDFYAEVASGAANGIFGVACYWKDLDNHHYVYFDRNQNEIWVGYLSNGEWIDIGDVIPMDKAAGLQKYAVDCTPGAITVYVNDQLLADVAIDQPAQVSQMLLSVTSYTDAEPGGIKVYFDDVSGYLAQQ